MRILRECFSAESNFSSLSDNQSERSVDPREIAEIVFPEERGSPLFRPRRTREPRLRTRRTTRWDSYGVRRWRLLKARHGVVKRWRGAIENRRAVSQQAARRKGRPLGRREIAVVIVTRI